MDLEEKTSKMPVLAVLACVCLLPPDAYAYIDPSAGIIALQALISALIAAVLFIKSPIKRFKAWLKKRKDTRAGP